MLKRATPGPALVAQLQSTLVGPEVPITEPQKSFVRLTTLLVNPRKQDLKMILT